MSKKEEFFKERFKQALDSTYKVISEEFDDLSKKENQKHIAVSYTHLTLPTTPYV